MLGGDDVGTGNGQADPWCARCAGGRERGMDAMDVVHAADELAATELGHLLATGFTADEAARKQCHPFAMSPVRNVTCSRERPVAPAARPGGVRPASRRERPNIMVAPPSAQASIAGMR